MTYLYEGTFVPSHHLQQATTLALFETGTVIISSLAMAQIINREANTGPDVHAESSAAPRISQACSACRRKKVGVESGATCRMNVLIHVTDQV